MGPGDVVADRFEVEAVAGTGGMGHVYRAHDRVTGVPVAIKVLYLEGEPERRRFAREARVLAELKHPGIVRHVADGTTADGEPYLVMEWLDGESLSQRLMRAPLDVAGAVEVVRRAAIALAVAHARGTVHRDVKPSNLFLCAGDPQRTKVLDFGLARFGPAVDVTAIGHVLGTPSYMAPEQAQGRRDVDARADVFALGCVLFRCLTGRAPFTAEDPGATLARLLLEEAPRVRSLRPDLSSALDDLIARMLSRDPDARPADGAAVAEALGALEGLHGVAVPSDVVPALTQVEKRLVAVVAAGEMHTHDESTLVDRPSLDLTTLDMVRTIARAHGAQVAQLHTERAVLALDAFGDAGELATQAARCALALRESWAVPVAVAMGWADGSSVNDHAPITTRAIARLERAADGASVPPASLRTRPVRLDPMTAGLLDARFQLTADPGGRSLVGERDLPPPRLLLGRATPCVGRERELAMLEGLFEECARESQARVALVTAPAGIGKSRLRYELVGRVAGRAEVFVARGDPMRVGAPFGMLVAELRRAANIRDGEDEALARQKVIARFGRNVPEVDRARVVTFLGELVGAPWDVEDVALRAARANPTLLGDQMRRAFEDFLAGECALRPVVLVLEDLHWGDLPTVRLVDSALRALADRPLFVLALARPEVEEAFPNLWSERGVAHLALSPLGARASEELARAGLGQMADAALVADLVRRANGNVFYLEELVRAASQGGALSDTVLAMVQARVYALEPNTRRVLRAASVFGRTFWRGGLVTLLGGPRASTLLDEWLGDLEEHELVTLQPTSRFPGERAYTFRHDLVREAAYATLTEEDRVLGHKLAASWLERAGEVQALPLAEHFERGGEGKRAAVFYARAATEALEGNDFAAAIDRTRRGIACGATGTLRGQLLRLRAEAHKWRAELEDSMRSALAAIDLLPLGTPAYFDAVADLASACGRLGRADVLAPVAEALEWVTPTRDARARFVLAAAAVIVQRVYVGDAIGAARMRARLEEVAADVADDPVAQAWAHRARSFTGLYSGDVATYLIEGRAAADCFDRVGDVRTATTLRAATGYAHMTLGLWEKAEEVLRAVLDHAERTGLQTIVTLAKHNLGMTLGRLGKWDEGRRVEQEAVAESVAQRDRRIEAPARTYLAVLQLESGEPAAALASAEMAAGVSVEGKPFALAVQSDALLALGDPEAALAKSIASEEATSSSRGAGDEEGALLALVVRAEALDRLGREAEAREVTERALRELDARAQKIADPAWRASFLERVPVHARLRARAR